MFPILNQGMVQNVQLVDSNTGTLGINSVVGGFKDAGPYWVTSFGVTGSATVFAAVSGTLTAVTDVPSVNQTLVVLGIIISTDTAMRVDLQEETTGKIIATLFLAANSSVNWVPRGKVKLSTAGKRLIVKPYVTGGNLALTTGYYSEQ